MAKARRRGTIVERGTGRWLVRVSLGVDPATGAQVRGNRVVRGTKRDAEQLLTELLGRQDRGQLHPTSRRTLGQWLDEYASTWSGHLAPRTRASDAEVLRLYLPAALRVVPLQRLTPRLVQDHYTTLLQRGLSAVTVHRLHRTLRVRLSRAVTLGYLTQNPLAERRVAPPAIRRREYRVLTPTEARILTEEAESDRYGALWVLMLLTGLRPEEVLGLKWDDLDGTQLRVRRALVRLGTGLWSLEPTKTRRGRTVALHAVAQRVLAKHRARQAELRLLVGPDYVDSGLIFASEFGAPLHWNTVVARSFRPLLGRVALRVIGGDPTRPAARGLTKRELRLAWDALRDRTRQALQQSGLGRTRPYDLRHSAASLLLAMGEHPKVVAEMLGHSKVTLTLDTYSHVLPGLQERAAERLEAAIFQEPRGRGASTGA